MVPQSSVTDKNIFIKTKTTRASFHFETFPLHLLSLRRPSEKAGLFDECEVVSRLQEQQDFIQEMRNMMEYQVSLQTGLVREVECLKDQLDLMRERYHNLSDTSGRYEDDGVGWVPGGGLLGRGDKLPSLRSEACLVASTSHSQSNLLEHSYTVSRTNLVFGEGASKVRL